jgi:phospho-N-acetylmuramoyl-pentapeptide-transferase
MIEQLMTNYAHISAFVLTLILSLVLGPIVIPLLKRLNFRQTVRDDGPQTHLVKTGIPIMGSIIFIVPLLIATALLGSRFPEIIPLTVVTLAFWAIGFADDMIKIVKKSKDGFHAYQKIALLLLVAVGFAFYAAKVMNLGPDIIIPFRGIEFTFNLGYAFIPFMVLVLLSTTNGVNLTDGLDGLATGITFMVVILLTFVAGFDSTLKYVSVFTAAIAGGCLGFLAFNLHPAKVFMGDSGSLALGGAIGAAAIVLKMPLILLIAGAVYVFETLSVIIQVLYFKKTRKRFFKMAPLHHHFELSGWKETQIVALFWGVTFLLCIVAFLSLGLEVNFLG